MPNDGVVHVNRFRTVRLKELTVDLMYADGNMYAGDSGSLLAVSAGDENMEREGIYEMDVVKGKDMGVVRLVRPRLRAMKRVPNSMDLVTRALPTATRDLMLNALFLDIKAMSFDIRERVYAMASPTRKAIVTTGMGRFQEWSQMMKSGFRSTPHINVEILKRKSEDGDSPPTLLNQQFCSKSTQILYFQPKRRDASSYGSHVR